MAPYRAVMVDYIDEYVTHLRTLGRAESTITTYTDILRRIDHDLPKGLARAHETELIGWIWSGGRDSATLALYRAAVRGFFGWATDPDVDELDFDPTTQLPRVRVPQREPRPVPAEELADILARAAAPYRVWFLLARYAGLRCVEIAGLDREHVTREHLLVVAGKGGKQRSIPTQLDMWAAVAPLPRGPVARSALGGRATRKQVKDRGNWHLQRTLGHVGITMHRLRHSFVSDIYRASDPFVAQRLAGHASVATTQIYAAVASDAMRAAVAALPRVGAR